MNKFMDLKGLTAIGSTQKDSKFLVQFANFIAKEDKVLYINSIHNEQYLKNIILASGNEMAKNFQLYSEKCDLSLPLFRELFGLVKNNQYSAVFIDDVDYTVLFELEDYRIEKGIYTAIELLRILQKKFYLKIAFPVKVNENYRGDNKWLRNEFFAWSSEIISHCSQIISIIDLEELDNAKGLLGGQGDKHSKFSARVCGNGTDLNDKQYFINFHAL